MIRACFGILSAAICVALTVAATATSADAATPTSHWSIISQPAPTDFHPGDKSDFYEVIALNDGAASTAGEIIVSDVLPKGVTVNAINAYAEIQGIEQTQNIEITGGCGQSTNEEVVTVKCSTTTEVPIGRTVVLNINVTVPGNATGPLTNAATIEAGGAPSAAVATNSTPVTSASEAVPYGASIVNDVTNANGEAATQAASHPFAFTTLLAFNVGAVNPNEKCNRSVTPSCAVVNRQAKDIEVSLPPGMVGNPTTVPKCTQAQFEAQRFDGCPPATQVGGMYLYFYGSGTAVQYAPVYNIEPVTGQPAELGFSVSTLAHIPMFFHVRSDGDYGLTADISNISQVDPVRAVALSIWGIPADPAHNALRQSILEECTLGCPSTAPPAPFLTLPSSCSGEQLTFSFASDSWQEVEPAPLRQLASSSLAGVSGCESGSLTFAPEIAVQPTTAKAGAPAGYGVELKVPQKEEPEELATPDVRNVEVKMPEGTAISPSAANGLVACSTTAEPDRPEGRFGLHSGTAGGCAPESIIGNVSITSPLLSMPLEGSVYVGQPECSPCTAQQAADGRMVKLLIEAETQEERQEPQRFPHPPVLIKLEGETKIDPTTGRLTTVFADNPQLPFSDLKLSLEEGPGAPLTNPSSCTQPAVTEASLTPWSSTTPVNILAPGFAVQGCEPLAFTPTVAAGMTESTRGGSFSPFSVTINRPDGQQDLGAVTLHTPPGLAGIIAKVPLCEEPRANAGTCPAASQIGETTAVVGAGPQPYVIKGGTVYLTTAYGGGSFGLSIVVPAEAGPYRLAGKNGSGGEGDGAVVVRGSIKVDPATAVLTITTNPIPTQLDGIPVHLRKVIVNVNRRRFMFNPTDCNTMSIKSTLISSTGTLASSKYPFQSTDCASLPFKPGFSVFTKARHSRRNGAYLHVHVTSGSGQANIKSVFVELPKILPSRISTLKLACTEAQFARNPAGCPKGSMVGTAVAHTPVLPVPLTGPAIFVSHGGAAFPDLDIVLQGDGVTIDLTGNTNIRKGITSSDFKSVPDVPLSSFDLTLPTSPHSALAANGNLCTKITGKHHSRRVLRMPTTITGQNGAVIKKTTKVKVADCRMATKPASSKKHKK